MAVVAVQKIIRHLRKVSLRQGERGLADGELLDCFLNDRDESAFTGLIHRFGPMVLGVCRRILQNRHDAEDAFQATFLILVRKGNTIVPREMVGNWLYGVAYRTALEARRAAAKRREKERTMPRKEAQTQDSCDDLQALIDQELHALPQKYRDPIVLCDLQDNTRQEAARKLGCPEGTVAGRLARGREMLAKRLTKHGIVISAAGLATFFSQNVVSAAVPMTLVSSTVQAALAGSVSAPVAALTQGVLQAMFITKVKTAAACLLAFCFLTAGLGIAWQSTRESTAQASVQQDTPRDKDKRADNQDKRGDKERPQPKDGVTVTGKLIAVAADSVTLEIVKRGEDATSKTFTLAKDAKIMRNGKDAKLAELVKGRQVTLTLSNDQKSVVSINGADRGDPAPTPPRGTPPASPPR